MCRQFENGGIPLSQGAQHMAIIPTAPNLFSFKLVKSDKLQEAQEKFEGTGVEIRVTGVRYLGAAIGSPSFKHEYITEKVQMWVAEIKSLSATCIAKTQPQAAYAVFVHAMKHKWTFLARTVQEASGLFMELEQAIDNFLIPAMTDRPPVSKEERQILSLPCRNGGLGLINPTQLHHHYQDSAHLTGPLADNIVAKVDSLGAATAMLAVRKRETQLATRARERAAAIEIRESADKPMKALLEMASEKGASSWLTCRPLRRHGFTLHKTVFRDGLCLRYGWTPERLPSLCVWSHIFCGPSADMRYRWLYSHASQWGQGPFCILPEEGSSWCRSGTALAAPCWWLVPSSLHVHGGICSPGCCCQRCLGRKVWAIVHGRPSFQPACSLQRQDVRTLYVQAAWGRKAAVVWGTCPWCWACLICAHCLLCGRGCGKAAAVLMKTLGSMLCEKRNEPFSVVIASMRCRISFALLRSAVASLRGHRAVRQKSPPEPSAELAVVECELALWDSCCVVFRVYQYKIIVYTGNSQCIS